MEWGYLRYDIGDGPLKFAVRIFLKAVYFYAILL